MNRYRGATVAVFGIAVCMLASGCAKRQAAAQGGQANFAMPVSAAPIKRGEITTYFNVTGTVAPRQSASLSSVVSGNVISVGAQIGERVRAGQLLVQIDDSTLRAQQGQAAANLEQVRANTSGGTTTAQANLESARVGYDTALANLQRNRQLFTQGYVSKSALDQAQEQASAAEASYRAAEVTSQNASLQSGRNSVAIASVHNAEAALAAVDAQIAQASVRAPFGGVVTARNVDPGSLASPGTVLMEVAQLDPVFVEAGVAGGDLKFVHVGSPATVAVDGTPGRRWTGRVSYLNLAAAPGTSIYQARISIGNPDLALRGGMVATVSFEQDHKANVLLAPRAAVFQTDTGYSMFVIDSGKAKTVSIDVGLSNDRQMEVSGPGLKAGALAILNHSVLLQPGTPVQVMPQQMGARY